MAEQRLPTVDADDGAWGSILNQFIAKEHYNTGLDNVANGGHKAVTLSPGANGAGTAPLKFTSGPLMTNAEAGAIEFLTDNLYFTQTTSTTRRVVTTYDTNSNIVANNLLEGCAVITTSAATTTLSVTDKYQQYFIGSTTQTVVMPVASTLVVGQQWQIINNSTGVDTAGVVTVKSSGSNTIVALPAGSYATLTCILNSGTGTSSWSYGQNAAHITVSKTQPTAAITGDLWIDTA